MAIFDARRLVSSHHLFGHKMLRSARQALRSPQASAYSLPTSSRQPRRGYAVTDPSTFPKVGEHVHGFTLNRIKQVPELELTAFHLQHNKTGAEYLHIARDDTNNVFSIGFKTNPPDATGVPHILEHTTLCGSERYPVRDPFFKMLPRSLSNFMNAWTFADFTGYPFATTNVQDFKNLMSVYLDATLHPLLKESDFTQEGWRIGPANPHAEQADTNGRKLVFKGVVYNEMKGQMSDASYLFYTKFQEHLYPAINNSGGDPQKITDLTWEQLRKFHADHYHPSNAKILTYGDIPLIEHLKEVDNRLEGFNKIAVDREIKEPITLDGPTHVTVAGPMDPLTQLDSQYKTSVTWLMGNTIDTVEHFALAVLSTLLTSGYGSPLYRNLIESGLGADFSVNTGYDSQGRRGVFSVGLDGVKEDDVLKVREAIAVTLLEVQKNGFEKIKIDGILHELELSIKHKTANFGMGILQKLKPGWFNGIDPMVALAWQETIDAFQENYKSGRYLEGLIEKYLLNDNTLSFTMRPSKSFNQELAEEENTRLAEKILETTRQFPNAEVAQNYFEQRELQLMEVQEKARDEDVSCLPTVYVKDIPREKEGKPLRHTELGNVKVQWREAPTNGLTYFRAVHRFYDLPDELREMMPLFTSALVRLGTKTKTMEQLEELMRLKTGGISIGHHFSQSPYSLADLEEGMAFSGYAFDRNVPDMLDLMRTLIQETNFDGPEAEKKLRELLQSSISGAVSSIAESGHDYAMRYAEAALSPVSRLAEQIGGLTQVKFVTNMASQKSLSDVVVKLKAIQAFTIANNDQFRIAMTCGPESTTGNEGALKQFLSRLPKDVSVPSKLQGNPNSRSLKSFFPLPYQVYYSARAVRTVPYVDAGSAPLEILSKLLTLKRLHPEIREKGGAYGASANTKDLTGLLTMSSYRDPNPQNSMKVMAESGQWARDYQWTARDLDEAKLSTFQGYDAPQSVSREGMRFFLSGVTDEMMQSRRERLLDVTAEQVQQVADQFLVQGATENSIAILGETTEWASPANGWEIKELGIAAEKIEEVVEQP